MRKSKKKAGFVSRFLAMISSLVILAVVFAGNSMPARATVSTYIIDLADGSYVGDWTPEHRSERYKDMMQSGQYMDLVWYEQNNPDVAAALGAFDFTRDFYDIPDFAEMPIDQRLAALDDATARFRADEKVYAQKYYQHYITCGMKEGRTSHDPSWDTDSRITAAATTQEKEAVIYDLLIHQEQQKYPAGTCNAITNVCSSFANALTNDLFGTQARWQINKTVVNVPQEHEGNGAQVMQDLAGLKPGDQLSFTWHDRGVSAGHVVVVLKVDSNGITECEGGVGGWGDSVGQRVCRWGAVITPAMLANYTGISYTSYY